jgi:hypothetical protein
MEWEGRLGRRLRVRDLYILSTVVKAGTMGKAARALSMSQPAVSEAVANLEHLLGVRLLDRSPRGIEPTIYAVAMLKRTTAVFDELKQGIRDIQSLADPTMGEISIGYSRAPRKIDFSANRGPFWGERLRIGTGTKPNHSGAILWRVIGGAYFSRCPQI